MLVIGSRNSSNSKRLVEVARDLGTEAYLIDNVREVAGGVAQGPRVVGISSGASAPENLVVELVDFFRERGVRDIPSTKSGARTSLHAPKQIRRNRHSAGERLAGAARVQPTIAGKRAPDRGGSVSLLGGVGAALLSSGGQRRSSSSRCTRRASGRIVSLTLLLEKWPETTWVMAPGPPIAEAFLDRRLEGAAGGDRRRARFRDVDCSWVEQ